MKHIITTYILLLNSLFAFAQQDTSLSIHIIGDKVCMDKTRLTINFSYYFENHLNSDMVVIDYYEPCLWEKIEQSNGDSNSKILALVLLIKDDSGKVMYPTRKIDTTLVVDDEKLRLDSAAFEKKYEKERLKEFEFHTCVLRPKDAMTGFFTMRLNKRKCFHANIFEFDYDRKYRVSLMYLAPDEIHQLVNKRLARHPEEIFVGKIVSNEIELCFK